MKRMLIQESERNEILSMHMIKEQTETTKAANATGEISPELGVLRKAIKAGCLKNGRILSNKEGTKYIYRATTRTGKQVDFLADMTYKFSDGVGGKWKCDKMTQVNASEILTNADNASKIASLKKEGWETLAELKVKGVNLTTLDKVYDTQTIGDVILYKIKGAVGDLTPGNSTKQFNEEQMAFINKYQKKGYEINPARVDRENMRPITAEELGAPSDLFPNGLTLYYNPNKQHNLDTTSTELGSDITNQSINRDACKQRVEQFYTAYSQRNSMVNDPATIIKAKNVVQACKDQYYPNKWGLVFSGKNKLNNYIEILSGDKDGGPGTIGSDKIFRLK
jgi:hypothetical protein